MSFFRNALLESFQKLYFGLGFPEFLNPKKIPKIRRENWAILEKLEDSANFSEIALWLRISRDSQPKKNAAPEIHIENCAILKKLQDSANPKPRFHFTEKGKSQLRKNLTIYLPPNNNPSAAVLLLPPKLRLFVVVDLVSVWDLGDICLVQLSE